MDIRNFDDVVEEYVPRQKAKSKNPLAPVHPFRMLVVAASGGGKTNLVCNLVMDYLVWDRLYIFAPDLTEDKYVWMIGTLKAIEDKYNEINETDEQMVWFSDKPEDIPDVNDLDENYQNVVIIDDSVVNKAANERVSELMIRGRKRNASVIYQTQSFFNVPKVMRLQANYVVLFTVAGQNELREICKVFATQVEYAEFKKLFAQCTGRPFGFMLLDLKTSKAPMKIRCGFDQLYFPDNMHVTDEDGKELKKSE